jgi:uncharacterized protein (DUF1800 family)
MKRLRYVVSATALLITAAAFPGASAGRYDQKLPLDKQPLHVLNRLTFGPRAADLEQIRRIGVEKWIDLQLHPEKITEDPKLEAKVKPLETLQMETWRVFEKYPPVPPGLMVRPPSLLAMNAMSIQQRSRLTNGSFEERIATLAALDAETRKSFLTTAPPQTLEGFPEGIRDEAAQLRKAQQDELQKEFRKRMPPLQDLLSQDQIRLARAGTKDEKIALINSLDAEKRQQVIRALGPGPLNEIPELRRESMAATQPMQVVNSELIDNKLYRAIYSNRQLEEVLVDFWMNHFNVFNGKGPVRVLATSFERDAIRPYVLGHFKDMLLATARHPAMLFYLDNAQSQVPREDLPVPIQLPPGARLPGLNENYGRELLELHTLGVDGGYTQQDVVAVARAFTGWTIYDPQKYAEFQFNPSGHDRKEKVVLGQTLPPGRGEQDGLDVIEILAHHPSTAKFISKELAQRFVSDEPPQALIDRMAATFTKTDGDLRAVLQTMFSSVEFMSEGAWQSKMKSPLEFVVGSLRALNAEVTDTFIVAQRIAELGEPLYGKLEPTGYPNTGEAWTNTASILGRFNFATALCGGQIAGAKVDMSKFNFKDARTVATEILTMAPSPSTLTAMEKGTQDKEITPSLLSTLVMSSPEFQRR